MTAKIKLEFSKAMEYEEKYKTVPLSAEIYADVRTPVEVIRILKNESGHCFLLESMEGKERRGRYTFIGFKPTAEITLKDGVLKYNGQALKAEPLSFLRRILEENRSPKIDGVPFSGGLVGYFAYDFIKYSEPALKFTGEDTEKFNDFDLMLFDRVITFDSVTQKITITASFRPDGGKKAYLKAEENIREIVSLILSGSLSSIPPLKLKSEIKPLFSKEEYCAMVEKAKQHIFEGDIFQAVLSNRFEAEAEGSLLDTYRILRTVNPSPYMFYFTSPDFEIAGASPETLVRKKGGKVFTYPLAGSRPRGRDEKEDKEIEKQLLSDQKELSEHNMLVDLGRNDLGRISKFGTVKVEEYLNVERFSHIMHIGSTVSGEIREGEDALSAISAVLPAGTLSGAPKLRAAEIINGLEDDRRGIYGGGVGYLDFNGDADMCIAIRIAYKKGGKVFARSGAGIVADSVPEKEYAECGNKAAAVLNALRAANGGIL